MFVNSTVSRSINNEKTESKDHLFFLHQISFSSFTLKHMHSRLAALELLRLMIPWVDDQIVLDRILPYVV